MAATGISPNVTVRREAYNCPVKKELPKAMLTDSPPRHSNLAGFQESDRLTRLDLPDDECLPAIAKSIESAIKAEQIARVRSTRDTSSARTCPSEQAREEAASSYAAALPGGR